MAKVIVDQEEFLVEAREIIGRIDELKADNEKLTLEEKQLEKVISTEKKTIQDEITLTIKKRKDEIATSYDREIGKDQEKLKKAKVRREKAKNQGIKERIEEETAELDEHNRELSSQIKTLFRQKGIPGFCNSLWYYALYFTKGIKEMSIFLVTFLVCFLLVPCGIYYAIPGRSYLYLVIIYLIAIVVFVGLYFFIYNKTKLHYLETLRQGRKIRNLISSNRKKMRVIASSIKKDKDEELYDLEQFDDEIAKLEGQISLTRKRKQEALTNFENVTKNILEDEITGNNQEKITELETKYQAILTKRERLEKDIKEQSIFMTDNYEVYLGTDFLQVDKINKLIEIITNKEAENITEAISVYKSLYN